MTRESSTYFKSVHLFIARRGNIWERNLNILTNILFPGEFNLFVEEVELGKFNEFECQVSPDMANQHGQLRAKAVLNVIGKCSK